MKAAARVDLDAGGGELVPAAKLGERYAEAIGNGDQGVAAARGVVDGVRDGEAAGATGTTSASTPSSLSLWSS